MATLLETVTTAVVSVSEQFQPKPTYLSMFFTPMPAQGTRYIEMDKMYSKARVASFINPEAVADGTEKLSFERVPFKLPTIQDKQSINGVDLEKFQIGEIQEASVRSLDRLDGHIFKIKEDQNTMIDTKVGISAIEVVFDGQLTVTGKGENRVLDFARPADLTVDVGSVDATQYWDDTGADIEQQLTDTLAVMGGYGMTGDTLIGRHSVIKYLKKNTNIKSLLDNRRTELGNIVHESMLAEKGVVYHGHFLELAIFSFDGVYQDAAGASQKAVPVNKVAICASNNNNIIQPAATPIVTGNGSEVMIGSDELMTIVGGGDRDVTVETIQTIAPLEAGVGSFATLQVLA